MLIIRVNIITVKYVSSPFLITLYTYMNWYVYAFGFKGLTVHSMHISTICVFPGYGMNAMLQHWNNRNTWCPTVNETSKSFVCHIHDANISGHICGMWFSPPAFSIYSFFPPFLHLLDSRHTPHKTCRYWGVMIYIYIYKDTHMYSTDTREVKSLRILERFEHTQFRER